MRQPHTEGFFNLGARLINNFAADLALELGVSIAALAGDVRRTEMKLASGLDFNGRGEVGRRTLKNAPSFKDLTLAAVNVKNVFWSAVFLAIERLPRKFEGGRQEPVLLKVFLLVSAIK